LRSPWSRRGNLCQKGMNWPSASRSIPFVQIHGRSSMWEKQPRNAAILSGSGRAEERLRAGKSFQWIQRNLPERIRTDQSLRLPRIYFLKENRRFYPMLNWPPIWLVCGLDSKGWRVSSCIRRPPERKEQCLRDGQGCHGRELYSARVRSRRKPLPEHFSDD